MHIGCFHNQCVPIIKFCETQYFASVQTINQQSYNRLLRPTQVRRQLREIGGEGAKLKSGGQRFSPKGEGFFWPKSQIFRPKADDLQKKKVFVEIRRLFLPDIANFNVFSAQKHQLHPPRKIPWGGQEKNRAGKNGNRGGIAGDAPGTTNIFSYCRFGVWAGEMFLGGRRPSWHPPPLVAALL